MSKSRIGTVVGVVLLTAAGASSAATYDAVAQLSSLSDTSGPWSARSTGGFGGYSTYQAPSQSVAMTAQGHSTGNAVINGSTIPAYALNSWSGGTQLSVSAGWMKNINFGQADFGTVKTGVHLHPYLVGSAYPYWRVDPMLQFKPTLSGPTTVRFSFQIASDYDLNGAQDWEANGQYLAFYHNDNVIDSDTYWPEDNTAATGTVVNTTADATGSNGDGWVYVPGWFARYSAPIVVTLDVLMNPGDTVSFRVNSASSNAYDGIFLTQATAAVPEPATLATIAGAALLGLRRRR